MFNPPFFYTLIRFPEFEIAIAGDNTVQVRASGNAGGGLRIEWTDHLQRFSNALRTAVRLQDIGRYSIGLPSNLKWAVDNGDRFGEERWAGLPPIFSLTPTDDEYTEINKLFGESLNSYNRFGTQEPVGAIGIASCRKFDLVAVFEDCHEESGHIRTDWIGPRSVFADSAKNSPEDDPKNRLVVILPNGRTIAPDGVGEDTCPKTTIGPVAFRFREDRLGSLTKYLI